MRVEQEATEWDELAEVQFRERADKIERLGDLGVEYRQIEEDFREDWAKKQDKYQEEPEKQKKYKRFLIRKHELGARINRAEAKVAARGMEQYQILELDQIATREDVENSIEVASAELYGDRLKDLREAIGEEPDEELKQRRLERLNRTLGLVEEHIYYKYRENRRIDANEARQYERGRTAAHNEMVKQLNWMNEMAENYEVERMTCRDFVTSEGYDQSKDVGGRVGERMKVDRSMVERFFSKAYKHQVNRLIKKLERTRDFY